VIAAKAGLAGMTKALALDLAPHHITVNCVVPGTIESQRGLPGVPERPAHRAAPPPMGGAASRKRSRRWCACSAGPTRATSPARRSTSTAADTCRDGIGGDAAPKHVYRPGAKKRLPPAVAEKTKHHVLDTVAAMVSGSRLPPGKKAISYARTRGGNKEACVVGSGIVTTAETRRWPTACWRTPMKPMTRMPRR